MITKRIYLEEGNDDVYLDAYVADKIDGYVRNAILVIPGGGYGFVSSQREGDAVAMAFMPYGYNAFVLNYSVARKKVFPSQLIEASLAMKHIKDNAEEYNINPDRVFATGFSAGGHLTASLGTLWHMKEIYDAVDMPYGYNKPKAVMPIYPVITGNPKCSHKGSFQNLFGTDEPSKEQLDMVSLELCVDERTCPVFMMHTSDDSCVPVENSLMFANALAKAGHKFELHIYPSGPHGIALANPVTSMGEPDYENPEIAKWVGMAAAWANSIE